jgi:hypothetical protein
MLTTGYIICVCGRAVTRQRHPITRTQVNMSRRLVIKVAVLYESTEGCTAARRSLFGSLDLQFHGPRNSGCPDFSLSHFEVRPAHCALRTSFASTATGDLRVIRNLWISLLLWPCLAHAQWVQVGFLSSEQNAAAPQNVVLASQAGEWQKEISLRERYNVKFGCMVSEPLVLPKLKSGPLAVRWEQGGMQFCYEFDSSSGPSDPDSPRPTQVGV